MAARRGSGAFDLDVIGAGLPFAAALDELHAAVAGPGVAVVKAPPGTGKTTLAPPALADQVLADRAGRVVVTQPRRVAARSASRRLTALTARSGSSGADRLVAHTVRGESTLGRDTAVEFVTPGVLVRRLLADPELPGVRAIVLDEVHERQLESDLALALVVELRELREDLPVVAMSATVEAERVAALLGGAGTPAPVVDVPAHTHPLEVTYRPAAVPRLDGRGVTRGFLDHVAGVAADGVPEEGDVLVFLPGVREIEHVVAALRARVGPGVEVAPLHGGLGTAEQDRVVAGPRPGGARRIVVSTDLAESSLTVPGVRVVVDACLTREPRLDTIRDMSGLVTVSASRDSCVQRAGRAARTGPGLAVRCLTEAEFAHLPAHRTPAVATSDLTSFALDAACWGAPRAVGLPLLDAPPVRALDRAEEVLRGLGAVDASGRATDRGRELARVPADPRLARALLDGAALVGPRAAAEVVAALSSEVRAPGGDLGAAVRELRQSGRSGAGVAWAREVRRLEALAGGPGASPHPPHAHFSSEKPRTDRAYGGSGDGGGRTPPAAGAAADEYAIGLVTALAHPDRVARRSGAQYTLASGTGASLPSGSPLTGREWLAIAEVARAEGRSAGRAGALVRAAAAIDPGTAELAAGGLADEETTTELGGGRVTARRTRRLGGIVLGSTPVTPSLDDVTRVVSAGIRERGMALLEPAASATALRRRLDLVRRELGDPWPEVTDEALAEGVPTWLGPELDALRSGRSAASLDVAAALLRLLPWGRTPDAGRLDELAPERLRVPSGSWHRLGYPEVGDDAPPVLAVKLQECFGLLRSPAICDGRVAVTVHLLSPAGRPLAVTGDLEYFWREAYPGVRAEMRGRYPKHPWPEDPLTATPTARTTRRS